MKLGGVASDLTALNRLFRSQNVLYENVKHDKRQLNFLTGVTSEFWDRISVGLF